MHKYTVTTELKTSWWLKILRFFRLKPTRESCYIIMCYNGYNVGDFIITSDGIKALVIGKE